MSAQDAELDLIRRAAAGEAAAMELFLLKHRRDLFRYLERHVPESLRRIIEPKDVLQDVYFEVFRNLGSFKAKDPRMALRWLLRIARNRIIDLVRMQQCDKRGGGQLTEVAGGANNEDDSILCMLEELAVSERTPSRSAAAHELLSALQRSLERLPEEHRQAIRHRYLEGMSIEQVATRMHRTGGSVLMLCNRGLKMLRMELRSFSRYM